MEKIVCLKLTSGEELMGKLDLETGKYSDVAAIMMVPNSQQNGQIGLALMPFLPYSDDTEFEFKEKDIMIRHTPSVEMINNYNRQYGAGIQVVKSI